MESGQSTSLQSDIVDELCKRRILQAEIALVKEKIEGFISAYMAELKPLYEELERVQTIWQQHDNAAASKRSYSRSSVNNMALYEAVEQNDNKVMNSEAFFEEEGAFLKVQMDQEDKDLAVREEITKLHRKLVKKCHPDIGEGDPDKKEIFDMVQNAYENSDMKMLVMVEHALFEEEALPSLEDGSDNSQEFLRHLKQENYSLRKEKESLNDSPVFALERQIRWAEMCGQQPMLRIKEDLLKDYQAIEEKLHKIGISLRQDANHAS